MGEPTEPDWTTAEGLAAIRDAFASRIEGWRQPVGYAVGLSSASSSPEWEFPHVNATGGGHNLPGVVLATVLGHDGSTATLPLSRADLAVAVETLTPAEQCTTIEHPNLAAWRAVLRDIQSNPMRELVAVYIGSLDDPVTSDADASLRGRFEGGGHLAG